MPYEPADAQISELSFDDFYCREFNNVLRQVFYVLGDADSAIEVTQEAFIQALKKWNKVKRFGVPFAWVRKVAVRMAIRNRRRRFREVTVKNVPEVSSKASYDGYLDVRRAVRELPRTQKAAVVLYYFEDLPLGEVANVMGCRSGTVKSHLSRARAHLAKVLRHLEEVA